MAITVRDDLPHIGIPDIGPGVLEAISVKLNNQKKISEYLSSLLLFNLKSR